ncbi:hypothetical protein [Henriciella sp.]|uniref:hypothetical protein n=1 Tax=Henriciella sp. TaxID=1968823 RepID=UPI002604F60C|nr:hypothetical protein [Henriciella sp.]
MNRAFRISLLALAFASGDLAFAEGTGKQERDLGELPSSLDRFVQNAIDEGLLTPATPDKEEPANEPRKLTPSDAPSQPPAEAQPELAQPVSARRIAPLRPKQAVAEAVCSDRDPYDFSAYHTLRTYDDLLAWRRSAEASQADNSDAALARAFISLGLNEEARLQLDGVVGPEASALRRLAYLMEGRSAPDVGYFREQAACPGVSGLWYTIALLSTDRKKAARRLNDEINEFRRLPMQLRIEVAASMVPALDAAGERLLASKTMANFTETEIATSTRLSFNKALLDMHTGGAVAEARMRNYLSEEQFREDALSSLLRHGYDVDREYKEDVAGTVFEDIRKSGEATAVASGLDTMLNDLEGVAGYGLTLQLADLPATQTPRAHDRIATHFVSLAQEGLESPDLLDNLEAMDALLVGSSLLENRPEGDQLYARAAARAVELGLQNLAGAFASRTDNAEELARARAALAFRTLDHEALRVIAKNYPDSEGIARLAALSAVRTGDKALLVSMEPRLKRDAETLVSLIEMDAASRHWMVPERIYAAAGEFEEAPYQARVRRVAALREKSTARQMPRNYSMAEIGTALDRIGQSLDPKSREAF